MYKKQKISTKSIKKVIAKVNTKYRNDHLKNTSAIVVSTLLFCVKHKSTDGCTYLIALTLTKAVVSCVDTLEKDIDPCH